MELQYQQWQPEQQQSELRMGSQPRRMMAFVESEGVFCFANLHQRYLECTRNKRNTFNALRFEARQELNLLELASALQDRSYRPCPL